MMKSNIVTFSILILLLSFLVFLLGIPPYDHVVYHYWTKYHPVARQMKAIRVANGLMMGSAAAAALDLGLFDVLHDYPHLTAAELAEKLNVPLRGIDPLLQVLATSDLIYERQGKYSNSETAELHWTSGVPAHQDMRGSLRLVGSSTFLQGSSKMTECIRNGGTVLEEHAETDSASFWEVFAKHTSNMASSTATKMVKKLSHLFQSPNKDQELLVLDIASGSGAYGYAVLERFPQARVIQNDYPNVLAITAQNAQERGMGADVMRRVGQEPGNFFEVELLDYEFDVVLAPNILHHFSPQRSLSFLQKIYSHLKPGGHVIIVEICRATQPYSVWEGQTPMQRAFSMTMLVWSKEGKAYSSDEMIHLLTDAGFEKAKLAGKSFPHGCFVTAQKPHPQ